MKYKLIVCDNGFDFEKRINSFLENEGTILDIKYIFDPDFLVAHILYEDNPLSVNEVKNDISWIAPLFEEAAKILAKNKERPIGRIEDIDTMPPLIKRG